MTKRRICFVTGTRAEYGLLYWLMKDIEADPDLDLQLIVTGSHLETVFGETVRDIENDGFAIDQRVPLGISGDSPQDVASAMARGLSGISEAFSRLRPDVIVLLGDRYEILAAAEAALLARLPVAHIHGGELTEGAIDDAMRHAITKMSHLHFTAAEEYRRRVIQMGEAPDAVFNVGAIGLDNIKRLELHDRDKLSEVLEFQLGKPFFLVTYHPETLGAMTPGSAIDELLKALNDFPDHLVVLTGVNTDPGHSEIASKMNAYADGNPGRVLLRQSLGQKNYLSAMKHCAAVVGNSSSGLIEAPAFPVPTVNIGNRQKGRIRAASVFDCGPSHREISEALASVRGDECQSRIDKAASPLGDGDVAEKILQVLKAADLETLTTKHFYDDAAREAV